MAGEGISWCVKMMGVGLRVIRRNESIKRSRSSPSTWRWGTPGSLSTEASSPSWLISLKWCSSCPAAHPLLPRSASRSISGPSWGSSVGLRNWVDRWSSSPCASQRRARCCSAVPRGRRRGGRAGAFRGSRGWATQRWKTHLLGGRS